MDPASQAPGHQEIGNQRNRGSEKQNTTSDITKKEEQQKTRVSGNWVMRELRTVTNRAFQTR
jgi:hypothetical protein